MPTQSPCLHKPLVLPDFLFAHFSIDTCNPRERPIAIGPTANIPQLHSQHVNSNETKKGSGDCQSIVPTFSETKDSMDSQYCRKNKTVFIVLSGKTAVKFLARWAVSCEREMKKGGPLSLGPSLAHYPIIEKCCYSSHPVLKRSATFQSPFNPNALWPDL